MTFHIAGKNMDIGEALRSHAEQRIVGAIEKYFGRGSNTHVVVEHEGTGFRAECTVHLDSGSVLSAEAKNHDARLAFDQAAEKLETQLRRYKSKLRDDHSGKSGTDLALPAEKPEGSD